MTTMESYQGRMLQASYTPPAPSGSPPAFEAIPSHRHTRNGVTIDREYFYYERGQGGISLSKLLRYNASEWTLNEDMDVGSRNGGGVRQKMTFLIDLEGHERFVKQKNVMRRNHGNSVPITQGKMAQCAAEVVERWLIECNPKGLRLEDLCLDTILQIKCTLQIYLAYRAPLVGPAPLECIAKSPDGQVPAGPSRCVRRVQFEGARTATAPLATVDRPSGSIYPYPQPPPLPSSSYEPTLPNYELYPANPQSATPWRQNPPFQPRASYSLSGTQDLSDRHSRNRAPFTGQNRVHPHSDGSEYWRWAGRRIPEGNQGGL